MLLPFLLASCNPNQERRYRMEMALPVLGSPDATLPWDALPGAPPMPDDTRRALARAWQRETAQQGSGSRHTEASDRPLYVNRLLLEKSPYLLQHANNPVNWFPWGEEAFELARRLGRPVLLSIGYSTCHWCHVMERESFQDLELAEFINRHYVPIKVDREERPDVDAIYMAALQMMTGSGGWPLTAWLNPDRVPFYAGTYFPARDGDRMNATGLLTLLRRLEQLYREDPDKIASVASTAVDALRKSMTSRPSGDLPGPELLTRVAASIRPYFDEREGGLLPAPKFPGNMPLRLLFREHARDGDQQALDMALLTLEKMAAGGLNDQLGGGFHRYSTDEHWLVPHFEKMLYDNAILVQAYLDAYQVTGRRDMARVVESVLAYVEREMTSPAGAFFAATDADGLDPSGALREGVYFTWTPGELARVLPPRQQQVVSLVLGVTREGHLEGRSVLHRAMSEEQAAAELGMATGELVAELDSALVLLRRARDRRTPPTRDEKIILSWNGLMISAFARASLVIQQGAPGPGSYLESAERAASFALENMLVSGRLRRVFLDGVSDIPGTLDDYAFLIAGLLDLFQVTGDRRWLDQAVSLEDATREHFQDSTHGGFFFTADDAETLLVREKPILDGARPSGNAVQAMNLIKLAGFTARDSYLRRALGTIAVAGSGMSRNPDAFSEMMLALDAFHAGMSEVILVIPRDQPSGPMVDLLTRGFFPHAMVVLHWERDDAARPASGGSLALLEGKTSIAGLPTAYLCRGGRCLPPTNDPEMVRQQLILPRH